jgi:hypothetical protein
MGDFFDYNNNYNEYNYDNYNEYNGLEKILSHPLAPFIGMIIIAIYIIYIIINYFIRYKSIKGKIININKLNNYNTLQDKFPYYKFPNFQFPFMHELEIEITNNNKKEIIILYRYYKKNQPITEIKGNKIYVYYDTFLKKYRYGGNSIIKKK